MELCNPAKYQTTRGKISNRTLERRELGSLRLSHKVNRKTMEPGDDPFKLMMEVDRLAGDLHQLDEKCGSHFFLKTVLCCNWTTRDPEGVISDALNQGNRLPNDSSTSKKKYILHPNRVIYGLGAR